MTGCRYTLLLLSLLLCALTGCTSLKQLSQLPDDYQVHEFTKADPGGPFDVSRTGTIAAATKGNIEIVNTDGTITDLPAAKVTAISFSPNGNKFAAALPGETSTVLRIFDSKGKVLAETTIFEYVTSLAWRSDAELLATGLKIKRFKFGAELTALLYDWDGVKAPTVTTLNAVTVRPHVAKMPEQTLLMTLKMALSPLGDEIAYTVLKDPPMFTPYLRVVTRHLETGAEHDIGKTSVGSGAPLYTPDSDSLLVPDMQSLTRRLSIPDGREMDAWPAAGAYPALSPSGEFLFLDGRLYREGKSVASFPTQSRGVFLPDRTGMAVSYDGKLYIVYGPRDEGAAPQPKDLQRLLQLRRLRSQGLISEKEYRGQRDQGAAR